MRNIKLPYHTSEVACSDARINSCRLVEPPSPAPLKDPGARLHAILKEHLHILVDNPYLSGKTIAIAISDDTRPIPYEILLPPVINILLNDGVNIPNIRLFIASGTHKPMEQSQIGKMLPIPEIAGIEIVRHDCDNRECLINLGKTPYGTDVWINKEYYQSDFKVVIGNIEPHHFMGYSGGVKTAAIGLAGRSTIEQNHAMLGQERTLPGYYHDNPMRQDVEAIGDFIGIDLAINTVMTPDFKIIDVIVDTPRKVMLAGIEICKQSMQMAGREQFDLVIASAGGYPKDINLYQAQKAITHALLFCKPGGVVILAAACSQGIGSDRLEDFMRGISNRDEAIKLFRSLGFQIGPHKAYQLALQSKYAKIILISNLSADTTRNYFMEPADDLDKAVSMALEHLPPNHSIAVLPHATHTIPYWPHM